MSLDVTTRLPTLAWTNINTGIGSVIQKGAGTLKALSIVNAGSSWEVDVYDGTASTGTRIAFFRGLTAPGTVTLDIPYTNGLFIDTVKGTTVGELLVTIL